MAVSWLHLVGTYENTDKVIASHLSDDWNNANTSNNTPNIENGTDEPDYNAQFDLSGPNAVLVNTIELNYDETEDEVNGDSVHSVHETVLITIVAESRVMRILIENEVNRILWELNINSANRLLKSNGTENSHVDHFTKSEVTFGQIELPDNETQHLQGSEGELIVISYKFRS